MWIIHTPPGLFGSLGPSLLAFTLHRSWSIGVNLSLNLHHAPSIAMSHPSPAHHKPRATSYATVLSITHHTKGANLPWFLITFVAGMEITFGSLNFIVAPDGRLRVSNLEATRIGQIESNSADHRSDSESDLLRV